MRGRTNAGDSEWSAEDLGNSGAEENFTNMSLEHEDPSQTYMRERRYSWPLLHKDQIKIPIERFNQQIDHIIQADDEY